MTGARTALGGPSETLLLAHRGTAYFLRRLTLLSEQEFDEAAARDSPLDRRRLIATVGYTARGFAALTEQLHIGMHGARTWAPGEYAEAVAHGTSLPPRALRNLVEHSAVHLAVEWRDLPAERWLLTGRDEQGRPLAVTDTPWIRAAQTWLAGVWLGNGGDLIDLPAGLLSRLPAQGSGSGAAGLATACLRH